MFSYQFDDSQYISTLNLMATGVGGVLHLDVFSWQGQFFLHLLHFYKNLIEIGVIGILNKFMSLTSRIIRLIMASVQAPLGKLARVEFFQAEENIAKPK